MSTNGDRTLPPSVKELTLLGFEKWQISLIKKYPLVAQWAAHDEMIRRLMSNDDIDGMTF